MFFLIETMNSAKIYSNVPRQQPGTLYIYISSGWIKEENKIISYWF